MTALILRYLSAFDGSSVWLYATRQERLRLTPETHPASRFEYICGEMQPNYPMPAIRLDADINDERVQIYNDTQHKLEYFYSF